MVKYIPKDYKIMLQNDQRLEHLYVALLEIYDILNPPGIVFSWIKTFC